MPKESGEMSHKDKHQFTDKVMEQTSPNKGAVKVDKTKKKCYRLLVCAKATGTMSSKHV